VSTLFAETVHTTGVNLDGVLANVGSITVILIALFGLLARVTKAQLKAAIAQQVAPLLEDIKSEIRKVQAEVDRHSTAIAGLQGFQEGRLTYQKQLDQSRRQTNDVANDP
jgi:hypothetical protein